MQCNLKKNTPELRCRKRKISRRDDKNTVLYSKRNPFVTSIEIKTTLGQQIDASTVRKRLTQQYVKAKVPKKCPFLSLNNIKNRKDFARKHVGWPSSKWRNILWSDETKINLFGSDALKIFVRRPKRKEHDPRYTVKTVKNGGGNIKIWGCFSYYGVGPLF